MNRAVDDNDWMNQSPMKGSELPELSKDDTVDLSAVLHNAEDYPVAATITDVDAPSSWTLDDLPDLDPSSSKEMTEQMINKQFCSNAVTHDGITSQQNGSQTSETYIRYRGASDVMVYYVDSLKSATTLGNNSHFNPYVEVPNGTTFGNRSISNAPEEPPITMENGMLRVQDFTYAAAVGQSRTQNAIGIQQPISKINSPQTAHNVSQKSSHEDPRCTCPKSRCIKGYCECFRQYTYCGNSCSCVNCQNNKDYEDTVEQEREKKRLQNPIACSPETNNRSNGTIPVRHKRGCNCRNSKCVKKYCECYQADVGCSEGCRCVDCKNPYNRKSDPNRMPNSNDNVPSASGVCFQQNVS